ncbi:MAG: precorrin-6A/cobalt-precorrin-6A reductase [Methanobacteriaceae archaeon]
MRILIMGGTKDSVNIIKLLNSNTGAFPHIDFILTTTATEHGGKIAKNAGSHSVISNPLNTNELVDTINDNGINVIIDATHPFAINATKTAISASDLANINYIRFERPSLANNFNNIDVNSSNNLYCGEDSNSNSNNQKYGQMLFNVSSFIEAGDLIKNKFNNKRILNLGGVSSLHILREYIPKENVFIRIIPVKSSIDKCYEMGLSGEQIIAMQGTFSKEFNKALFKEINAEVIVTKESGATGGFLNKINAAIELDIPVIIINRPKLDELKNRIVVNDFNKLCNILSNL